jgi:hypothetical protein
MNLQLWDCLQKQLVIVVWKVENQIKNEKFVDILFLLTALNYIQFIASNIIPILIWKFKCWRKASLRLLLQLQISFSKMMNENCLPFQSTYIHARCSVGFVLLNLVSYVLPSGPFIIGLTIANVSHTILLEFQCDYKIGIILKIYENLTSIEDYIWIDMN